MSTNAIVTGLLAVMDNQVTRTAAAFEDLPDDAFKAEPGGDCHSIAGIGAHLVGLRRFQLSLLGSDKTEQVTVDPAPITVGELMERLVAAEGLVRQAIAEHDLDDWLATPSEPRQGPWGDEPTLLRLVRPLNDFTNHLGAVRAIRRILGCPAQRVQ